MNKAELIDVIAKNSSLTKKDSEAALDAFMDVVTAHLKKEGDKITLVGFGTFEVRMKKETTKVNPQTKAKMHIPARLYIKFKVSHTINDALK